MALLLPAVLNGAHEFVEKGDEKSNIDAELQFSRFVSVILLITYCVYLYFQLVTHTHLFEGEDTGEDEENVLGFWGAISWLGILTIFISLLSEGLVEAIKGRSENRSETRTESRSESRSDCMACVCAMPLTDTHGLTTSPCFILSQVPQKTGVLALFLLAQL
jgi:hypothetical protein